MLEHIVVNVAALIHLARRLDLFAGLLGFIMLYAILMEPLISLLWRLSRLLARWLRLVQVLDERAVRLLAMLSFSVMLRSRLASLPISHRCVLC